MSTIRELFEKEVKGLEKALNALNGKDFNALERLREEMWLIRACQQKVHSIVQELPFEDEAREIEYHKQLYPRLRALHIYRVEVYLLEKDVPPLGEEGVRAYYGEQLRRLFSDVRRYEFLYTYFKLKATDLDSLYFTEKANRQSVLLPVLAKPEPGNTTETGYLFARFIAGEMLFKYIINRLDNVKQPFRWTGETVNLIELLHGIYLNNQVNNGEVGIVEFFNGMGEFFGVDLGIPKKGFDALKKRKKLSKTHFTDRMRDSLVQRMDEEDDWEREKRLKNKSGF
ncbi:hypothetical protein FHW88_000440 [Mucilaginibacter sp. SG538B]|uniref:RteC domain-containing protein n=1 Tax=Mucilaginibacter sp. SG538B TaxID=2587021 RepID=UPI00159DDF5A|nr:RteC domain-containing protein [Mucilaginibacter sp. SG538B]NVM62164.1 hypothetical protein [Mucilaginibacter sp. SG538B]